MKPTKSGNIKSILEIASLVLFTFFICATIVLMAKTDQANQQIGRQNILFYTY
jgi:hypothetical protein